MALNLATKSDIRWWKNAVFYSTYVDKFAGNFSGMADRLEYLSILGVDCIHLLPFYPSSGIDDGYDVTDYTDIRKGLGTLSDFDRFVQAAHAHGIRVLIDLVLNHTSTEHPWFREKKDFYLWSKTGGEYAGAPNPFSILKSSNWIRNAATDNYYFSTWYPEQADLNWYNPAVFEEMMRVVDFWTAHGVDGFRLDAASHLIKKEGTNSVGLPETHAILKKIRRYLEDHHPGVVLLGEASGKDPVATLKEYFGEGDGDECHLIYHFPLVGKLFLNLKRNDANVMNEIMEESKTLPLNAQWATLLRHHDEMPTSTLPDNERDELLDYFDAEKKFRFNHGTSLRLASMFQGDRQKNLDAFKLLFSVPGSPIIYYGDEIGMQNDGLVAGEKDTRRAIRGTFDWRAAQAAVKDPASLFNGIADMIQARK